MILISDLGMEYPTSRSKKKTRFGIYECPKCNKHFRAGTNNVKLGLTTKCRPCASKVSNMKHGESQTRIYRVWNDMVSRCNNPKSIDYSSYGGRGIKVCKEWLDIKNFIKWAKSNGYTNTLTVDRVDNDGNYEPFNVRFSSRKVQANNRRTSILNRFSEDELSEICELYTNTNTTQCKLSELTGIGQKSISRLVKDKK